MEFARIVRDMFKIYVFIICADFAAFVAHHSTATRVPLTILPGDYEVKDIQAGSKKKKKSKRVTNLNLNEEEERLSNLLNEFIETDKIKYPKYKPKHKDNGSDSSTVA